VNRTREPLHSLVDALRALLETAGPEAEAFMRDWPPELIARPVGARALPVVAALRGLPRMAAPRTRGLVEGIEALAGELDLRQLYCKAREQRRPGVGTSAMRGAVSRNAPKKASSDLRANRKSAPPY
jgi:hypothetical protein